MLDNKFKIVFANASACQFFGKSVLGKNLKTVFKNSSLLALAEHLNEESTISKTIPEWDLVGEKKQKLTFQIKMDKLPAPTKDGAIMAISFFDITPFKLFKEQQADFFANASHELKTPLAVISGCVETLQGEAKNDPAATQKFLNLIAEQNARMTDLVQKMLKLARFQSNISSRNQTSIAINELIQKVISDFYPRIQSLNKKIIFNKGRNIPLFQASTDELYHVFQNLIDNALKYGADKSVVRVSSHFDEKQKTLIISVHNFGPPIPKENLNRVFDKFFRVESGKSLTAEGNGLGLGIVQQIVQRYHGKVEVQSSQKDGTTFFVYLPTEE